MTRIEGAADGAARLPGMAEKPAADAAPLALYSGVPRDDHRPLGTARAGIAPGQIDEAAAIAASVDGAGEPLPSRADRVAQGLGADPAPDTPQPGAVRGNIAAGHSDRGQHAR